MTRALLGLFSVVVVAFANACAECSVEGDCGDTFTCSEGACVAINDIVVVDQQRNDDGTWRVTLDARFAGTLATVLVNRASTDGGDPCVAFPARRVVVSKATAAIDTVAVVVDDLPALASSFTLQFTLLTTSTVSAFATLDGSIGGDVGGFTLTAPDEGVVDVVTNPFIEVSVDAAVADATVVVRPLTGPPLPRQTLLEDDGVRRRRVLLARGPQIVEVEGVVGGVVRRCARAYDGSGDGDDGIELYLLAEPAGTANGTGDTGTDALAWLELSARARDASTTTCDSTVDVSGCISGPTPATPSLQVVQQLRLQPAPLIDIAVVPIAASLPVDALVRITVDGAHLGVFGPMTIAPAAGESWIAGQLVVVDDDVTAVASSTAPAVGAPW